MDPFSVSVGTLTIIDACLKCGKILVKLFNDHQAAQKRVSEALIKLKVVWNKTEVQMTFLKEIWSSLDSNLQRNQVLLLSILENKLQEAIRLLNSVIGAESDSTSLPSILSKRGVFRKNKYVLRVEDSLDTTLSQLMEWHALFDPSWFLLARATSSDLDQRLKSNPNEGPLKLLSALRKSVRDLNSDTNGPVRPISSRDFLGPRRPVASSPIVVAQIEGRIQDGVVDTMIVNPDMDSAGTTRSVVALSKALSRLDPTAFGLLRCCGVINKTDRYEFVFEIPQGFTSPRSLRDLLLHSQPSLNVRLDFAKQLAKSIFYLHTAGFVHKNIRPETILVFDCGEDMSAFLFGFENYRAVQADTFKRGDGLVERDLYRHPYRQGNDPEREYVMQHDIYSLGVCLLEIGLWESFVRTENNRTVTEFMVEEFKDDARNRAFAVKQRMLTTLDKQLCQRTGHRFKNIVETCLTCLDDGGTWSHVDGKSESDIDVGLDFIENVLLQLQEIVI